MKITELFDTLETAVSRVATTQRVVDDLDAKLKTAQSVAAEAVTAAKGLQAQLQSQIANLLPVSDSRVRTG